MQNAAQSKQDRYYEKQRLKNQPPQPFTYQPPAEQEQRSNVFSSAPEKTPDQKESIYQQQIRLVQFVDTDTGEVKQVERFCLKGSWKKPRPGRPDMFRFGGEKTSIELRAMGYKSIHGVVEALYHKLLNLRGNILTATIYDNAAPKGQQEIFKILSDGTERFNDRLYKYRNFITI